MRRFIAVDIGFPESSSNFLCFVNSFICHSLNEEGKVVKGLCLFGDAAYANNMKMALPYKGAQAGPKDAYNFLHSQLRINIECAFGMLVHRWYISNNHTLSICIYIFVPKNIIYIIYYNKFFM